MFQLARGGLCGDFKCFNPVYYFGLFCLWELTDLGKVTEGITEEKSVHRSSKSLPPWIGAYCLETDACFLMLCPQCTLSEAAEVRLGSQRRRLCPALVVWTGVSELQPCIAHIPMVLFLVKGVTQSRGREVWELRMLCVQGSTPSIHPGNLLMETNASCQCSGSPRVDEKPVSSLLLCSGPRTKRRVGFYKCLSAAWVFSRGLRVCRIQWFKTLNPSISLDHYHQLTHRKLPGVELLSFKTQALISHSVSLQKNTSTSLSP